ncbi:MgtC/SapB family protein [Aureimonas fodinaquatilis]|uniref:Protein MgtC n=1 Tax=Aureimonas fodinaquatilis TaxID=2565783 RepID=A0A5B0DWE9_9HYPH|nr:MgtC/SapB family protein [Aureimonas fodinaquatilis]KAA0969519.1 MgtC/SapB family protein [Aureimonas fodinaquatilis]
MLETDVIMRLSLAVAGGLLLGLDRELRGISAGIRTHGIVALSSAAITVSALMLYETLSAQNPNNSIDPLRVVQGLAQAIGFIAAGAIFFARGDVHNLTSAANLWLAAALGITSGAGQFVLFFTALALGLVLITGIRVLEKYLPDFKRGDDSADVPEVEGRSNAPNRAVTDKDGYRKKGQTPDRSEQNSTTGI